MPGPYVTNQDCACWRWADCAVHHPFGFISKARYGVAAPLRARDLPSGAVQGGDIASQHIAGDEWARQIAVGDETLWVEERAVNKRVPVG